jgi:hypothetical protein
MNFYLSEIFKKQWGLLYGLIVPKSYMNHFRILKFNY